MIRLRVALAWKILRRRDLLTVAQPQAAFLAAGVTLLGELEDGDTVSCVTVYADCGGQQVAYQWRPWDQDAARWVRDESTGRYVLAEVQAEELR